MSRDWTLVSETENRSPIEGLWYPSGSSRATTASASLSDGQKWQVADAAGARLASGNLASVEISPRVGSISRRLTFADGSVFETADNDAIDEALASLGKRHAGLVHSLERFHPRLAIFVVVVVLLGVGIYRFAVPALVEIAVAVTPPVVPQLLSQSVMASLDRTVFDPSKLDADTQQDIADDFRALSALASRGADGFTLNFRKGGPIGPNAFALPDGTLVLTDELVELADDNEAVLGVLAHEIGHVEHQHSLRQLYRAAGVTGLIFLIGGDIGAGTEDILIQGAALVTLSYSRGMESESDRYSVELMHKAGRDPMAIVRFLELLRDKLHDESEADFLSTHPATPARIEETRRYAEELMAKDN
jgi:predicted Zn-dependent protease